MGPVELPLLHSAIYAPEESNFVCRFIRPVLNTVEDGARLTPFPP